MRVTFAFAAVGTALVYGCAPYVVGAWAISAKCPAESRLGERAITATAAMTEVSKGKYRGTIINSLGQKGELESTFDDEIMSAVVKWQGSGKTEALLKYKASDRTFSGTDTEGCTLSVRRP